MSEPGDVTRREVFKRTAGVVIGSQVTALQPLFAEAPPLRFFTPQEFALVDELTEILIPSDDHSPGARAAGVAPFLDGQLAEAFEDTPRATWRAGLAAVERLAQTLHEGAFSTLTPAQRVEVVSRLAANEQTPTTDEERFFVELKSRTLHAYYTSEIGIHKEMEYKGNTLLMEFAGVDVSQREKAGRE